MRTAVALLALAVSSTSFGGDAAPPGLQMSFAISRAMQSVCGVDRDSRQCEILQLLYADQLEVTRGEKSAPAPHVSPDVRAIIRKTIKQETPGLDDSGMMQLEAVVLRNYMRDQGIR